LVEDLRTLGRSAVEAFIERQGDGDVGETVDYGWHTLKRLVAIRDARSPILARLPIFGKYERSDWREQHWRIERGLLNANIWMFAMFRQKHQKEPQR